MTVLTIMLSVIEVQYCAYASLPNVTAHILKTHSSAFNVTKQQCLDSRPVIIWNAMHGNNLCSYLA